MIRCMLSHTRSSQSSSAISALAKELGVTDSIALNYLRATATQCREEQQALFTSILAYVKQQTSAGLMQPLSFCCRQAYDKTKLRVRVVLDEESQHAGVHGAKVFILQSSFGMLVNTRPSPSADWSPLLILGDFPATMRCTDGIRGECVVQLLSGGPCLLPPEVFRLFGVVNRISECDQAKGNSRGERFYEKIFDSQLPQVSTLHWTCTAHRLHAVSDKVWALSPATLKGATNVLVSLQSAEQLSQLLLAINILIEKRARFRVTPLTLEAQEHRQHVLSLFWPSSKHSRKRTVLVAAACLWNCNWLERETLDHQCLSQNCCASRQHLVTKMQCMARQLLKSLHPSQLCKANWA